MRPRKKTNKKRLIILLSILAVVSVGATTYFLLSSGSKKSDTNQDQIAQQPSDASESQDEKSFGEPADPNTPSSLEDEKDSTPAYEGEDVNNAELLSGVINYSAVVGDKLTIRTTINQTVSTGTCNLTLTNGSKTVTKTSGIMQNPSSASCEGFDVPVSELGSGNWSIPIAISSGGKSGNLKGSVKI